MTEIQCWPKAIEMYVECIQTNCIASDKMSLQTKGGFLYVPSDCGQRLMLPAKYLEELKTAPINEVDCVTTFIQVLCTMKV